MPVDDHPVHEKVRHTAVVAGCWGSGEPLDGYWAKDGLIMKEDPLTGHKVALQKMTWVPHAFERDGCRQIGVMRDGDWTMLDECIKDGVTCPRIKAMYIDKARSDITAEMKRFMRAPEL